MIIDWFTVIAQALNFVVLVFLLKRFLFKPILAAIDKREEHIAAELAAADTAKAEALEARTGFEHKRDELDEQRAELMRKATDEAAAERERLRGEAREAADAAGVQRQDALRSELSELHHALIRRTQEEVFAIARKALTDIASTSLEASATQAFTRRLRALDEPSKAALKNAFATSSGPAIVRSAFALPDAERADLQNALDEMFSEKLEVRFETAPELVSGIELAAAGQKLAWSISDYLASLEHSVGELIGSSPTAIAESA